ncbi:MAG TPA: hypothetical protein VFS08_01735 [Gemmatimonadaceae bacterium]|nr:hypothetical protein [Gemmatimonadaceae bacterium]
MTAPKLTHLPDVLEEHFEELQFLWGRRPAALRSPAHTARTLAELDERIAARLQGLLAQGEHTLPLLEAGLAGDDPMAVFAAAFTLLHLGGEPALGRVREALAGAEGPRLEALRQAVCAGPAGALLPSLEALVRMAAPPVAVAAAEAVAVQAGVAPEAARLERFLHDDDPAVRTGAWRIVANVAPPLEARTYAAGLRDEPPVRRAAIDAAMWTGQPGIVDVARRAAEAPAPENLDLLHVLAVLGGPAELPRIAAVARATALGPARFALLGAYGHPALVDLLLTELLNPDPVVAAAAGAAFTRMTGADIDSGQRATAPPPDGVEPDAFEAEFAEEVALPDPERARRHWAAVCEGLAQASRICAGHDLARPLDAEAAARLDLESRWEMYLRARFAGAWRGSPRDLEHFPQR